MDSVLQAYPYTIIVDPIIAAARDGDVFPGCDRAFWGPLDGGSLLDGRQGKALGGNVNLIAGIDMPYAGSFSFIAAQLAAGLLDLINGRDPSLPARIALWHTTRSDKWFAAFRPFFRAAAALGLGSLFVDDSVWYESKPIAFTEFTLADGISAEVAKAQLDTLLEMNKGGNVTALYRA